jgi:hypothetical protein
VGLDEMVVTRRDSAACGVPAGRKCAGWELLTLAVAVNAMANVVVTFNRVTTLPPLHASPAKSACPARSRCHSNSRSSPQRGSAPASLEDQVMVGDALPFQDLMAACEEVASRANAAAGP